MGFPPRFELSPSFSYSLNSMHLFLLGEDNCIDINILLVDLYFLTISELRIRIHISSRYVPGN